MCVSICPITSPLKSKSDLPLTTAQTEMLISTHKVTHLILIEPAERSALSAPSVVRLLLQLSDEGSNQLASDLERSTAFIRTSVDAGGCVLVHSFQDMHVRLIFAAYRRS